MSALTPAALNAQKRAARHQATAGDRTLRAILSKSGQLLARSPAVWLFGLAIAFLGWTNLPVTIVADAVISPANPVNRGALGLGLVVVLAIAAFVLEVALVRTMVATDGGGPLASLASSVAQVGRIAGFFITSMAAAILIAFIISSPLWWLLWTWLGLFIDMITLGFAWYVIFVLTSLALVLPFWLMVPLALRAIAIGKRGAAEALMDAVTLLPERFRLALFAFASWLLLDLAILGLGWQLGARDLSLPALLGVVTEWTGTSVLAGVLMLVLTAAAAAFLAALWTAVYRALAAPLGLDRPGTAELTPDADETRREALWLLPQFGRAASVLRRAPVLLLLAAVIAFFGTPTSADLVTYLNLAPGPQQPANQDVSGYLRDNLSLSTTQYAGMYVLFFVISLVFSAGLAVATAGPLSGQPAHIGEALRRGAARLVRVLLAEIVWFAAVGLIGVTLLFTVLLGLALIVQVAPGLDPLTEAVQWPVALLTLFAATGLAPFVARAVLLDNTPALRAFRRAFAAFNSRPAPLVAVFLFTFALDLLHGPIATLAGLTTSGWLSFAALLFRNNLDQPLGSGTLVGGIILFLVSIVVIAFKAGLWTQLYLQTAPALTPQEVAGPEAEPPASHSSSRRRRNATQTVTEATLPVETTRPETADEPTSA